MVERSHKGTRTHKRKAVMRAEPREGALYLDRLEL